MELSVRAINLLFGILVISILVHAVTAFKFGSVREMVHKPKSYVTAENVDRSLECLAMNIYKEAGHEVFEGKVAIAQVTLNRVDAPKFPKDICSVVYQKNVVMEKVVCQFSWYCEPKARNRPSDKAWEESYAIAKKVLLEGFRLEVLEGALYFHAVYVNPSWPHERVAKIGNHIFYRSKT